MILKFVETVSEDENLRLAINIANNFLKTKQAQLTFTSDFKLNSHFTQSKMNDLRVIFSVQDKEEKDVNHFIWTNRDMHTNVINVNDNFRKRLADVQAKDGPECKEAQIIIVFIAIIILHELAHLVFRWKGIMDTPQDLGEAGNFLETKMFGGIVFILVHDQNSSWNEKSHHVGEFLFNFCFFSLILTF